MRRLLYIVLFLCVFFSPTVHAQILPSDGPLTIDEKLQALGERLLQGKQGSIIAIEPTSGEVKCMVSSSYFYDDVNRGISLAYSPGSTFKTAQALTMLSEYILNKDSKFTCHKGFWCDNIHIGCHPHRSPQALIGAIAHSCNSYFCKAFMAMMKNRDRFEDNRQAINIWHDYMTSMGFGAPLGIDMAGETSGLVPDAAMLDSIHNGSWNEKTIMWMGMGQGEIKATPLQLCNLAALIANKGSYLVPHIHKPTPEKPLDEKYTTLHYAKVSPSAYKIVIEGMRQAITVGTAMSLNTPDYQICGKTGTAENTGDDHSIFIAFAPMESPKIAICVYVENGGFGADLAAPLAGLMIEQYLTGRLSARSEHKAEQWELFSVEPPLPDEEDDMVPVTEPPVSTLTTKTGKSATSKKTSKSASTPTTSAKKTSRAVSKTSSKTSKTTNANKAKTSKTTVSKRTARK